MIQLSFEQGLRKGGCTIKLHKNEDMRISDYIQIITQ